MPNKNNYSRNMGSVSHGTMREEDLIPTFISELESMKPLKREHRKELTRIKKASEAENYYQDQDASFDLEWLFEALEAYCLPYFRFGSHPGDGADYGYWLWEDFQEEFDGLKVSDTSEVPKGYTGEVLHINDHGNVTLYVYNRGKSREVWAVV